MITNEELLKAYFHLDYEFYNWIDVKFRLSFLNDSGYDVETLLNFVELKIEHLLFLRLEYYKHYLIMKGQLPTDCFRRCEFNCLECSVAKYAEEFL